MAEYVVYQADLNRDREQVIAVWSRNLKPRPHKAQVQKFDWHYRDNPCGLGKCWLLATTPGGEVVGTCGLGMRRMRLGGKSILVGHASDLAVDARHRGIRPAVMLQRTMQRAIAEGLTFIYTAPNDRAQAAMRLAGFRTVGHFARFAKVLNVGPYLRHVPAFPRAAIAPALNVALRVGSSAGWAPSARYRLERLADTDERFDDLWERAARHSELIGERTSEFLRWRYLRCPLQDFDLFGLVSTSDERLAGYCVCWLSPERQFSVIDLLGESDVAVRQMLSLLVRQARRSGADSISISAAGSWVSALLRAGFRRRKDVRAVLASPPQVVEGLLNRPGGAYLLPGDEDYND